MARESSRTSRGIESSHATDREPHTCLRFTLTLLSAPRRISCADDRQRATEVLAIRHI